MLSDIIEELKVKNRVYLVHIYTSKAKSKELQNSHPHKDYYAIIFSFLYFLYFCKNIYHENQKQIQENAS